SSNVPGFIEQHTMWPSSMKQVPPNMRLEVTPGRLPIRRRMRSASSCSLDTCAMWFSALRIGGVPGEVGGDGVPGQVAAGEDQLARCKPPGVGAEQSRRQGQQLGRPA